MWQTGSARTSFDFSECHSSSAQYILQEKGWSKLMDSVNIKNVNKEGIMIAKYNNSAV